MTRLNLFLLAIVVACALALVTSQHKARRLYSELQQQQEIAHKAGVEWGQLQLEQSAWATRSRIEKIATTELHMIVPPPTRIQAVLLHAGGGTR